MAGVKLETLIIVDVFLVFLGFFSAEVSSLLVSSPILSASQGWRIYIYCSAVGGLLLS